jgi:heme exporter protein CcmD
MPELGKYTVAVLGSYGVAALGLGLLVAVTWLRSRAVTRRLRRFEAEARRNG